MQCMIIDKVAGLCLLTAIATKRPMFGWLVGSKRLDPYTALTCLKFNNLKANVSQEILNWHSLRHSHSAEL